MVVAVVDRDQAREAASAAWQHRLNGLISIKPEWYELSVCCVHASTIFPISSEDEVAVLWRKQGKQGPPREDFFQILHQQENAYLAPDTKFCMMHDNYVHH